MKHLYALALLLVLASCAATKKLPQYTEAEKQAQRESISWWKPAPPPATYMVPAKDSADAAQYEAAPDSLPFVKVPQKPVPPYEIEGDKRGFLARIFLPKKATPPTGATSPPVPRKCKGCIFNIAGGNQSNTTSTTGKKATAATGAGAVATVIEKAKAPVGTGTGDVTDQAGASAASTIKGDNNAPVLTNTQQEAADWKAQLASGFATPVGKVAAVAVAGLLGYGLYYVWFLIPRRKKRADTATDTTTV